MVTIFIGFCHTTTQICLKYILFCFNKVLWMGVRVTSLHQNLSVMSWSKVSGCSFFSVERGLKVLRRYSENRIFQVFTFLPSSFTLVLPHFHNSLVCFSSTGGLVLVFQSYLTNFSFKNNFSHIFISY